LLSNTQIKFLNANSMQLVAANWARFLMWKCIISEHFTDKTSGFDMVHVFIVKPPKGPACISHVFKSVLYQCQYVTKKSVCLDAICLCVKFAFIIMHVEQICMEFNDWNWLRYNDQCTNLLIKIHRHITGFLINVLYWHTQLTMTQGWKLVWNYAAVAMNILHWLFKSGQTTAKTHWISPWKPTQTIS